MPKMVGHWKHLVDLAALRGWGIGGDLCKTDSTESSQETLQWYLGGPELSYFPVPVADPDCLWGGPCDQCSP